MTPNELHQWLKGYFAALGENAPTEAQARQIKEAVEKTTSDPAPLPQIYPVYPVYPDTTGDHIKFGPDITCDGHWTVSSGELGNTVTSSTIKSDFELIN